jgi:hypothetical protein
MPVRVLAGMRRGRTRHRCWGVAQRQSHATRPRGVSGLTSDPAKAHPSQVPLLSNPS